MGVSRPSPRSEVHRSAPSDDEVKNSWCYTSTPPTPSLSAAYWQMLTFIFSTESAESTVKAHKPPKTATQSVLLKLMNSTIGNTSGWSNAKPVATFTSRKKNILVFLAVTTSRIAFWFLRLSRVENWYLSMQVGFNLNSHVL
jgi:hypothetical protein